MEGFNVMTKEEMDEIIKTFDLDMIHASGDNGSYDATMAIVGNLNQRLSVYGLRCISYEDFYDLKDYISDRKSSLPVFNGKDL